MSLFASQQIAAVIESYGYFAVAAIVGVESLGVPIPGEATLIAAAVYAGTTQRLDIAGVIASAILGTIVGDNVGYWVGRRVGQPWLARHGHRVHLTPTRLKIGRYLFDRHGGKVVLLGRFVTVLRSTAALLAGVNRMDWRRFAACNVAGGVAWATAYGSAAYAIGEAVTSVLAPVGLVLFALAAASMVGGLVYARRQESVLGARAEAAYPDRLDA